jgi:uncharacterized membrane protein
MDNLAILRFQEPAKAYQAFTELKALAGAGAFELHEAAVVAADGSGALATKDSVGLDATAGADTGSLIGILLGILGGPLGVLLGWLTGSAVGASLDAAHADDAAAALSWVGRALPPGATGVIAILTEPTADALDAMVGRLGGTVERQSAAAVHDALESANQAEVAARAAADKTMREARAGAIHSKWEEVKASVKKIFAPHPAPKA